MALRELTDAELAGVAGGHCHGKKKSGMRKRGGGAGAGATMQEAMAGGQQFSDDEVAQLRAMLRPPTDGQPARDRVDPISAGQGSSQGT